MTSGMHLKGVQMFKKVIGKIFILSCGIGGKMFQFQYQNDPFTESVRLCGSKPNT